MEKKIDTRLLATLGGGILFSYLFWMEYQALNLLVYSVFLLTFIALDRSMEKTKKILLTGAAHLISAILVVTLHTDLTIVSWYISLAVFTGYTHFQAIRSIFTAVGGALLQFFSTPVNIIRGLISAHFGSVSFQPVLRPLAIIAIPLFLLLLFTLLYGNASATFARYLDQIGNVFSIVFAGVFDFLFADLSFLRFLHLMLGIMLTGAVFIGFRDKALERAELACTDQLYRKKRNRESTNIGQEMLEILAGTFINKKMALKTENTIAIACFIMLNLLLLSFNVVDLNTVWRNAFANPAGANLSAALHDGANALIASIILAMLVIIYFFNGNLNFYSRNRTIRILAYIWMVQNAFLVLSVLVRDLNYIAAMGLTYKRIGVIVFLLLCSAGLITVYIKVSARKTIFYLLRVNTLIWYCLLLTFSFVNWDVLIVQYNIANRNSIQLDLDHLQSMSDKTLPLLWEHRALFKNENLLDRVMSFKKRYARQSWQSYNYADQKTWEYFKTAKK
ncbi:DUF4153 domain-containing protein [Pedobacter faecalis]|uniref:DUF4153 domain-containing protein n=1 Tax=Pedobacter faecalis TaxID=3041495 RepID=UPI00254C3A39|nr:DUF4173 domain-containing protein [Pedobacter sp. ELA7]